MAISVPPKGDADKKIGAHMAPLSVQAQDTPNMTVKIRAGWFYNTNGDAMEYSGGNSPTITPPGANAKWVIVAINNSASIVLVNGTAAASPTLPALPAGYTPLAFVYVPSTATTLTNEKIFDARPFLRGLDIVPNLATELADRPTFTDMNNALDTKADNSGTPDYTFYLNNDDSPAADAMYAVKRGASADVAIRWNETLDRWEFTNDGVTFVEMASVSGTFMPLQLLAVAGNIGVFNGVGEVVDSLQSLTGMATDAEVTAAVAAHAADATLHLTVAQNTLLDGLAGTLTAAELNFVDGVTSAIQPQLDSKATDTLVVHLAGPETITGVKTFTASPVFQAVGDSFIEFNKGATDDAGIHVNRGVDPIAAIEWDETTDQWMAGTLGGGMFPILTAENLALQDLTDVDNTLTPAAGDVLRFVAGEWTNDPLSDLATDVEVAAAVAAHAGDATLHLTANQNTFLDALNLPTLVAADVNQLAGITVLETGDIGVTVQAWDNDLDSLANTNYAVNGLAGIPTPVTNITFPVSPYTMGSGEEVILANASGGAIVVNLPTPASGRRAVVKKVDATANTVTVDQSAAELIDGAASFVLNNQWDAVSVVSNGTDWFIV